MTFLFRTVRMIAASLALLGATPSISRAHDYALGTISIAHPWAMPTAQGARTGAGYLKITNRGQVAMRLIGGSSLFAGRVEIHSMTIEGGIMRMRPLSAGVLIPAGGRLEFRPGGLHLMLTGLRQRLVLNDRVPLTLLFEGGMKISVILFVELPQGAPTHQGH